MQRWVSWTWELQSWWYLSYPNLSIYRDLGEWLWVDVSLIWQWHQLQLLFQMWSLFAEAEQLLPYPVFYSIAICRVHQKHFLFTWKGQQYTFTVLTMGHVISPSLWHNIVLRNFILPFLTASMAPLHWCHHPDRIWWARSRKYYKCLSKTYANQKAGDIPHENLREVSRNSML